MMLTAYCSPLLRLFMENDVTNLFELVKRGFVDISKISGK